MKSIVPILWFMVLFCSCWQENTLTPSEGTEEIFSIPQGEHPYDSIVMDWFDRYGFYVLYGFEEKDLYWYNEEWIEGGRPDISTAGTELGKPGNEDYVGYVLDIFDKFMLQCYPEDFIKKGMPLRVFVCSELWDYSLENYYDENWNFISDYVYHKIWLYEGWDNIALNGASSYITDSLTRRDQLEYSEALNIYFLQRLAEERLIPMPGEEFFGISTYENTSYSGVELFANGYLSSDTRNTDKAVYKENDFFSYCRLAGYPLEILNGEAKPEDDFSSLNEEYDYPPLEGLFSRPESALCKQKYEIVVKHLRSLGIDMDKIQYPEELNY